MDLSSPDGVMEYGVDTSIDSMAWALALIDSLSSRIAWDMIKYLNFLSKYQVVIFTDEHQMLRTIFCMQLLTAKPYEPRLPLSA